MIDTNSLLHILVDIEPWLNFVALLAILRAGLSERFPAMRNYLVLRCASDVILLFILKENLIFHVSNVTQTVTYIYAYWISYAVVAVAIFLALQEVFKALMDPVPGLQRLGLIIFRWVSVASAILLIGIGSSPQYQGGSKGMIFASLVGIQMMRCISILEICLLAYLAISLNSLGRSFRGRVFGIGFGFGLQACGELIVSMMLPRFHSIWSWQNLVVEIPATAAVVIWTVYLVLPEPAEERGPITLPITSPLLRWNDIASALGQRPAHVALGATSSAFFLQDVEEVVDKFLTKTP
jgi:hypothetical protein